MKANLHSFPTEKCLNENKMLLFIFNTSGLLRYSFAAVPQTSFSEGVDHLRYWSPYFTLWSHVLKYVRETNFPHSDNTFNSAPPPTSAQACVKYVIATLRVAQLEESHALPHNGYCVKYALLTLHSDQLENQQCALFTCTWRWPPNSICILDL